MNPQTDIVKHLSPEERTLIQKQATVRSIQVGTSTAVLLMIGNQALKEQNWYAKNIPPLARPILLIGITLFSFVRSGQLSLKQATHDVYMKHAHGQYST